MSKELERAIEKAMRESFERRETVGVGVKRIADAVAPLLEAKDKRIKELELGVEKNLYNMSKVLIVADLLGFDASATAIEIHDGVRAFKAQLDKQQAYIKDYSPCDVCHLEIAGDKNRCAEYVEKRNCHIWQAWNEVTNGGE